MTSLGQLGVTHVHFKTTFGWFGHEISVSSTFSPLDMIDFMEAAASVEDEQDPRSVTLIKDLFRSLVDPDDFDVFWQSAKDNRQTMEDLMRVYQEVTAGLSKDRSGQPSESSDGTSKIGLRSLDASVSPVTETSLVDRVVAREEGRPDIQLAIRNAQHGLTA